MNTSRAGTSKRRRRSAPLTYQFRLKSSTKRQGRRTEVSAASSSSVLALSDESSDSESDFCLPSRSRTKTPTKRKDISVPKRMLISIQVDLTPEDDEDCNFIPSSSSSNINDSSTEANDEQVHKPTKNQKGKAVNISSESDAETDIPSIVSRRSKKESCKAQSLPKKPKHMSRGEWSRVRLETMHPELKGIWEKIEKAPPNVPTQCDQPADLKLTLLPFQREGLSWMRKQEETEIRGGILADEMGMGKTIQMISLLLSESRVKSSLVVAPTVALMQWKSELNSFTDALSVYIYYGSQRTKNKEDLLKHDVVLTTYSVMESVYRRERYGHRRMGELIKEPSVLHGISWARVVLDEAHNIKDRSCNTARAAFALNAKYRWALSGTPLQNRVGELYSLIRYLRSDPFCYYFCYDCKCKSYNWNFSNWRNCDDCGHSVMK